MGHKAHRTRGRKRFAADQVLDRHTKLRGGELGFLAQPDGHLDAGPVVKGEAFVETRLEAAGRGQAVQRFFKTGFLLAREGFFGEKNSHGLLREGGAGSGHDFHFSSLSFRCRAGMTAPGILIRMTQPQ